MNALTSVALILLLSLLAGHLVKFLRIPEVTGYIIAGIVVGPSVLGWVDASNLNSLSVLSEVALGLILFSIGSVFELERFRRIGRKVILLVALEAAIICALVSIGTRLMGQPWTIALLLGTVAIETGAASTLMVLREYNAHGDFTELLSAYLAVNNLVCLAAFLVVTSIFRLTGNLSAPVPASLYEIIFGIVWQFLGAAAFGYLVGLLLSAWSTRVVEQGETLILLIGCILLCVGASVMFGFSALIVSLVLGSTTANLSSHTGRLAHVQSQTDPPFYAVFFVIAGAHLQLGLLRSLGALGIVYIVARLAGKLFGSAIGIQLTDIPTGNVGARFGFSTLAHAGLALGLVFDLKAQFPEVSEAFVTVVLGGVLVYEVIGPVLVRKVLIRSRESRARASQPVEYAM